MPQPYHLKPYPLALFLLIPLDKQTAKIVDRQFISFAPGTTSPPISRRSTSRAQRWLPNRVEVQLYPCNHWTQWRFYGRGFLYLPTLMFLRDLEDTEEIFLPDRSSS